MAPATSRGRGQVTGAATHAPEQTARVEATGQGPAVGEPAGGMGTPQWGLFADWCAATGHPALPTTWPTVAVFLTEVPCRPAVAARRLRAIRRAHQHARDAGEHAWPAASSLVLPRPRVPVTAWRASQAWLPLRDALAALPVTGWPDGVRARRDGLVLVAVGHLGFTRARTAALTTGQVRLTPSGPASVTLDGQPVHAAKEPPDRCPACAITRWCRALAAWQREWADAAWYALEDELWHPLDPDRHDCTTPVPPGWVYARTMVPRIGPHLGPKTSLPPRLTPVRPNTISAILAQRRHPSAATPVIEQPPDAVALKPRVSRAAGTASSEEEFDDLFDRLDARITQLDADTAALLAAAE